MTLAERLDAERYSGPVRGRNSLAGKAVRPRNGLPTDVACGFCGAQIREMCMATNPETKHRYPTKPHSARVRAWLAESRTK
ncbi:MAG TPA: hypothetical protein VIV12_06280 [Streptosporangiaceae bacterium]